MTEKEKNRERQRRWYAANKQKQKLKVLQNRQKNIDKVKQFLLGKVCEKCGDSNVNHLEFHHLNRDTKDRDVKKMAWEGVSFDKILIEIKKCNILCGNCHREMEQKDFSELTRTGKIYRRKKEKILGLTEKKCSYCGYSKCTAALEFHHLYDKKFTISGNNLSKNIEEIREEINKCIVLCVNCHKDEHLDK